MGEGKKVAGCPGEKIDVTSAGRLDTATTAGCRNKGCVIKDKKGRIHGHPTDPETPA